ncbi:thioredoxin reductase [Methylorubrum extorquens]|nr:thioredoxin reductase [Methylorubrum extorquens]
MHDVIIVGGGPAGLNAALILGRARRKVLLCDASQPRNAATPLTWGLFTRDGTPPFDLRAKGRGRPRPVRDSRVPRRRGDGSRT